MNGSVGSVGVAAWIAQVAFWVLIVLGIGYGDLSKTAAIPFVLSSFTGYLGIHRILWWAGWVDCT